MFPFAPRLLRTFTAAHLGNESALRQGTDRSALRRVYAACRSAWIRGSRVVTWFPTGEPLGHHFPIRVKIAARIVRGRNQKAAYR